ncbi:hypothetical protein Xmau_00486 [Xenorhabdus mauleonii]|uniref:Uncharacterized protein n=1 Tax=Xenorhabdus mauleonii TaxID=351675 RepID=A0A1I3J546_9GAMM|nr:hypothetical protein Xmau_00486 [Xenorhabdus mauleonii]SFI55078.1 hypothetical protein SAMN05421680_10281 [Xenorhabdus mauleonii]
MFQLAETGMHVEFSNISNFRVLINYFKMNAWNCFL